MGSPRISHDLEEMRNMNWKGFLTKTEEEEELGGRVRALPPSKGVQFIFTQVAKRLLPRLKSLKSFALKGKRPGTSKAHWA